MDDNEIIALYQSRDERAIKQTAEKYSGHLTKIALNVLGNHQDGEECVNDTYFRAWNTIPPHIPAVLKAYLGKITRELSIDRLRRKTSKKRGGTQYELSLDELGECAGAGDASEQAELSELVEIIEQFLRRCRDDKRDMFVCRYYFCDSIKEIAGYFGVNVSKVKNTLFQMRAELKKQLESEGYVI